jgi:2-polyprenyl-6-hydroxyphenyl methylase/3-demethylubiquinone-9 3-methyltransferase
MSSTDHNPAVAFHDQLAERWEQKYARSTFSKRATAILTMPAGEVQAGEHWLDAGCGTGTIARRLAQQGCRVTAVDGSARMIAAAERAAAPGTGSMPLCFLRVKDVAELPFADAAFDAIVCSSVLEYVDAPSLVLGELARVLRPGGRLIVSIPNRRAVLRRTQRLTHWITSRCGLAPWPRYIGLSRHAYTREEFAEVLQASAFEAQAWRYYGAGLPDAVSATRYGGGLLIAACVKSQPRGGTTAAARLREPGGR